MLRAMCEANGWAENLCICNFCATAQNMLKTWSNTVELMWTSGLSSTNKIWVIVLVQGKTTLAYGGIVNTNIRIGKAGFASVYQPKKHGSSFILGWPVSCHVGVSILSKPTIYHPVNQPSTTQWWEFWRSKEVTTLPISDWTLMIPTTAAK